MPAATDHLRLVEVDYGHIDAPCHAMATALVQALTRTCPVNVNLAKIRSVRQFEDENVYAHLSRITDVYNESWHRAARQRHAKSCFLAGLLGTTADDIKKKDLVGWKHE